jgi:hypothetical protein
MTSKMFARILPLLLAHGLAGCSGSNLDAPLLASPPPPTTLAVGTVVPGNGWMGSPVRITGSGFSSGATVTLGGVATNVVVVNSTVITATTPVDSAGTVDVVVTNPSGQSARLTGAYTYDVVTLTVSATLVQPGDQLSVSWVAPSGRSVVDWLGLFKPEDPSTSYENGWWQYTNGITSGTHTLRAPNQPGQYEFRYLLDDGYIDVARSAPLTVR